VPLEDREFHVERARAELDAAYRAATTAGASAHLELFSLHMRRARALGHCGTPVAEELGKPSRDAAKVELAWLAGCAPLHEKYLA